MSALEQLLDQYRKESNIKKSRKRPRESTEAEKTHMPERTTKTCTNQTPKSSGLALSTNPQLNY